MNVEDLEYATMMYDLGQITDEEYGKAIQSYIETDNQALSVLQGICGVRLRTTGGNT